MELLTVKEVAELRNCTERNIKKLITDDKLQAEKTLNDRNRPKYLIPLTALDTELQAKYYNQIAKSTTAIASAHIKPDKLKSGKPLDQYSADEREQIDFWLHIVDEWQAYRSKAKRKTDVDPLYCAKIKLDYPDIDISPDTLYRRLSFIKENDFDGLIDKRGKHKKGKSTVQDVMWDAFLFYYLDEAQHTLAKCYRYMRLAIEDSYPELVPAIPHSASFRRKLYNDVPVPLRVLGREGEKAYRDKCGYYVAREYDNMVSNDYWIGDTHTIDVQSQDGSGTVHRLYLSAWMDARSGVMVGWNIATSSSSQNTLLALRHAILRHGIPKNVYVDNGREFLNYDIGGLGHRAKKSKANEETCAPPPIFKRLNINMVNAIVKNARAKTIERRFRDFKESVSRLFGTYTGGHIKERPEILKARLKNGEIVVDTDLISQVNDMIEFVLNYEEYNGAVKADHGKRKIDVYNQYLTNKRTAPVEELNLMLMRSSRSQTYGRRGVHLNINGERIDYINEDLRQALFGKKVYYRYDPSDLSSVRLYDTDDRYIGDAQCDDKMVLAYGAGKDDIKLAQRTIRLTERKDKDALKAVRKLGHKAARELVLAQAMRNKDNPAEQANPKVVSIHRADEKPLLQKVVGYEPANLDTMIENSIKKQGGTQNV